MSREVGRPAGAPTLTDRVKRSALFVAVVVALVALHVAVLSAAEVVWDVPSAVYLVSLLALLVPARVAASRLGLV